jgi:hypothetical protein
MFLPYLGRSALPGLLRSAAGGKTGRKIVGSYKSPDKGIDYSYMGRSATGLRPTINNLLSKKTLGLLGAGSLIGGILGSDDGQAISPMPNFRPSETNLDSTNSSSVSPRFEQILFPGISGQATNKELIDAAILRGSLELLKPRQPGENFASQAARALEAGISVNQQTTGVYPTAQEALQAAKAAGFKNIKVYAKGNGFGYTGEVGGLNDYFPSEEGTGEETGEETGLQVLSKDEYEKAVGLILNEFPKATQQDIIDTLNNQGYTYEG